MLREDSQEEEPLVGDNLESQAEGLVRNDSGEFNLQKKTNFKEIFGKVWRNGMVVFGGLQCREIVFLTNLNQVFSPLLS
jgi:hypothetical protein